MRTIENIATVVVYIGSFIWLIVLIWLIFARVVRKKKFTIRDTLSLYELSSKNKVMFSIVMLAVLIIFLWGNNAFLEIIGHHSLEDESDGVYCYYIKIEQDYGSDTYVLPAQIRIESEREEDGDRTRYWREYYIEKAFFSNGNYLDFTNYIESTSLDSGVTLTDQNGNEWKCSILNRHAYYPEVVETTHITFWNLMELILICCIFIYNWFGCFYKINESA